MSFILANCVRASAIALILLAAMGCASRDCQSPYADADVAARLDPLCPIADEWNDTDIVPNGETRPVSWVVAELSLEPHRFWSREVDGAMMNTAYLRFQVAPSYEVSVMTYLRNVYDPESDRLRVESAFSPDLEVYGVRVRRRSH